MQDGNELRIGVNIETTGFIFKNTDSKLNFVLPLINRTNKINIYLDDLRDCPDRFVLARDASECRWLLLNNEVNILSLDHDLGDSNAETGYDFCKWLVEEGLDKPYIYPKVIYLHTANGVGRNNMFQLLNRYKPDWVKLHRSPMPNND